MRTRSSQQPYSKKAPTGPSGFTVAELVVVVVILAILAAIVIPDFTRRIEQGYRREAADLLETIFNGERAYCFTKSQLDNAPGTPTLQHYYPSAGTLTKNSSHTEWGNIFMDNPYVSSIPQVDFEVKATGSGTCDSGATFTATAKRVNDPCRPQRSLSITQQGGEPTAETSWPKNGACP